MFLHLICSAIESLFKDFSVGGWGGGATTRRGFTMTYAERKGGGGQNPSYTGGSYICKERPCIEGVLSTFICFLSQGRQDRFIV